MLLLVSTEGGDRCPTPRYGSAFPAFPAMLLLPTLLSAGCFWIDPGDHADLLANLGEPTADSRCQTTEWYRDADGDGFGDREDPITDCARPEGYAAVSTDCDDTRPAVNPDATELCDGTDNDCNEAVDDVEGCDTGDTGADTGDTGTDTGSNPGVGYTTDWGSEMVAIAPGSFWMGGGLADPDGSYRDHKVTLTRPFWLGRTELTQTEWAKWNGSADAAPSDHAACPDCPVEQVSWYDAAMYANALSEAEGLDPCYEADGTDMLGIYSWDPPSCLGYRFPTEAEWEYAARAGEDLEYAGSNNPAEVAWTTETSGYETHDVCGLAANAWGLCDMSGNVFEWTGDLYGANYGGYGDGQDSTDPPGPEVGDADWRVYRGGAFIFDAPASRPTYRDYVSPHNPAEEVGFRLARTVPASAAYVNSWGGTMLPVVAGSFTMGGGKSDIYLEYWDHTVLLTHNFWMGQTEVTQAQWAKWSAAYSAHPSLFDGCDDCPVDQVSWSDAAEYANALSTEEGLEECYLPNGAELAVAYRGDPYSCPGYRLPTEAEWEYAARADEDTIYAGSDVIEDVAWYEENSEYTTHAGCSLAANGWGFCDMSGNLTEWIGDWFEVEYGGYVDGSSQTNPAGPDSSSVSARSIRGGGWEMQEYAERVDNRTSVSGDQRNPGYGFRLVRSAD